jgi:hypothetical protein
MPELSLAALRGLLPQMGGANFGVAGPQELADMPLTGLDRAVKYALPFEERPVEPRDETVAYRTPYGNLTTGDIDRATEMAMGFSSGGLSTKGIRAGLSMDEASRLARATEQGFTRDVFRGEGRPIEGTSFIEGHPARYDPGFLGGDAIYSTNRPHLANDYATLKAAREFDNGAPNVMPLKLKMDNPHVISADDKRRIAGMDRWDRDAWLRDEVYGKGHDGVIVKYGNGDPARRSSGYEEYVAPTASYRSRFAQFDPANVGKAGLLGSLAAMIGVGAARRE